MWSHRDRRRFISWILIVYNAKSNQKTQNWEWTLVFGTIEWQLNSAREYVDVIIMRINSMKMKKSANKSNKYSKKLPDRRSRCEANKRKATAAKKRQQYKLKFTINDWLSAAYLKTAHTNSVRLRVSFEMVGDSALSARWSIECVVFVFALCTIAKFISIFARRPVLYECWIWIWKSSMWLSWEVYGNRIEMDCDESKSASSISLQIMA